MRQLAKLGARRVMKRHAPYISERVSKIRLLLSHNDSTFHLPSNS
jgi:hypothetical protein